MVDASLALDAAEFPAQFPMLFGSDIVEILADDSGIPAQEVDAVPVGGIDTHLLHELEGGATLFTEFVLLPGFALDVFATLIVFGAAHLPEAISAPVGVLVNDALLDIIPVTNRVQCPDGGVEPSEVSYLLFHRFLRFRSLP